VDTERFGPIDFDLFHRDELPARLGTCGPVFTDSDRGLVRPLAFQLPDGRAYTYVPSARSFAIDPGSDRADTVVEVDHDNWCAFVWELRSCFAMLYADQISVGRGSFGQLARWEPSLRVAFDGQALYDLDEPPPVEDGAGNPLDLTRTFTLADPREEIADFLQRAGFVHLREVMDEGEVGQLRAEVDLAVDEARPDDRRSWWTTVGDRDVCNRVNYLNDRSTLIAGLGADDRFVRIAASGVLISATPRTDWTATVWSSRSPGPPTDWSTSRGTVTAAWEGTRSSAPCSMWEYNSTRPMPPPASSR
jgi:hypothetical protein